MRKKKIREAFGIVGITVGIIVDWILERKFVNFSDTTNIFNRILRIIFGGVAVVAIRIGSSPLMSILDGRAVTFFATFSMFFVIMFLWPAFFNFVEKFINKRRVVYRV